MTLCLAVLFLQSIFPIVVADDVVYVTLEEKNPDEHPKGHKSSSFNLIVSYSDNTLSVYSPYTIERAEIIIRDVYKVALYHVVTSLNSGINSFLLPYEVTSGMYSIEIVFNKHDLFGYF